MKFRATATPMDAPMPPYPPPPMAADRATTVAEIVEVLVAVRVTSAALVRTLSAAKAFARDRITFWATAPAPLIARPASLPIPTATEAATEIALMVLRLTPILPAAVNSST